MRARDDEGSKAAELIQTGSELGGAVAGAAIGLIGGPPGAMGGAAAGVLLARTLRRIGGEIWGRAFSPRERMRTGAAYAFAAAAIAERLARGDEARADWFGAGAGIEVADELLEGVLLNAADAYEERKVKYMGLFYASLAFHPEIDRPYANYLLGVAARVTYRELAVLVFFATSEHHPALATVDAARRSGTTRASDPIVAELTELGQIGLLGLRQRDGRVVAPLRTFGEDTGDGWSWSLEGVVPTSVGRDLHQLMQLHEMPREDRDAVYVELGGDARNLP